MPDTGLILYEFPCSEKIRFYLRLEALKQRIRAAEQARKAQPAFALAAAYAELPDDAIIEL